MENSDTVHLSDQDIIAKTAWGEARGLGREGMWATISTLQNRVSSGVSWWGNTLRSVCIHPWQYSCWNANDPNRPKLLSVTTDDPQYAIAMSLAADALDGSLADITGGGDSYYASSVSSIPKWADGLSPCFELGNQLYFRTVNICGTLSTNT